MNDETIKFKILYNIIDYSILLVYTSYNIILNEL